MFANVPRNYEDYLAPYACKSSLSRGRRDKEMPHPFRNPFQRDRDRIVHTKAFRRLEYKTQVLINSIGDHYRTRLTHTIEVSLVSRSICRVLGLHEDLSEAIALAHDLGHPPFGHAGEEILNDIMSEHSGFEHNIQSFRIVNILESPYPQFTGLNLTYEVKRSLLKSCSQKTIAELIPEEDIINDTEPIEAQVVDMADEITYIAHDLEDALNYNFLSFEKIKDVGLIKLILKDLPYNNKSSDKVFNHNLSRYVLDYLVKDLVTASQKKISKENISSFDSALKIDNIICLSEGTLKLFLELKSFLYKEFYHHKKIDIMFSEAERVLRALFTHYLHNLSLLPEKTAEKDLLRTPERIVCDYLAGMTDRFILEDYQRVFT